MFKRFLRSLDTLSDFRRFSGISHGLGDTGLKTHPNFIEMFEVFLVNAIKFTFFLGGHTHNIVCGLYLKQ